MHRLMMCLLVVFSVAACQTENTAHEPSAPPFERLRAPGLSALQDSLMTALSPDSFLVRFRGDPRNPDRDAAILNIDVLRGPAHYTTDATDDDLSTTRVTLDGHNRHTVVLRFETEATPDVAPEDTLVIRQHAATHPTSEAVFRLGRQTFTSRSGWVRLVEAPDGHLRGAFLYELQSPDLEGDWFELVGVFDAVER